jgi:hypothetical protein
VGAANYVESAERNWATDEISWGIWDIPEAEVGALPDVTDMDVVELGCGTGYVSAWLARGRMTTVSSSTCPTASGSRCSAATV